MLGILKLRECLESLGLHCATLKVRGQVEWVRVTSNTVDHFSEVVDEAALDPWCSREFWLHLSTGRYVLRVWSIAHDRGVIKDEEEVRSWDSKFCMPCCGYG